MKISCKICGSLKFKHFLSSNNYNLYRCLNCKVVFLHPQPNITKAINSNIKKYDLKSTVNMYFKSASKLYRRALIYAKNISKYKHGNKLLDVGCSYGFYSNAFVDQNYSVIGIDISKKAINYAKKKLNHVINDSYIEHRFSSTSYDIITMFDVIEHFVDPNKAIKKTWNLLNKKGIVIIQTPNIDSVMSKICKKEWFWLLSPEHLFLFNLQSLKSILENNGFKILEISSWDDYEELVKNILYILKLKNKGKTRIIYSILYHIAQKFIFLSYLWSSKYFGGELYVYAQKV